MLRLRPSPTVLSTSAPRCRRRRHGAALSVLLAALAGPGLPAHAGVLDKLFGQSASTGAVAAASPGQRLWTPHEFTRLERVPAEPGAAPNQQPVQVPAETLRQLLLQVETTVGGARVPLFAPDEVGELVGPLVQALGVAGPGDDLLLLSSDRRESGILGSPKAVTARLFVQDGSLQMIVHDARFDFYDQYRGTYVKPTFVYGSRNGPSGATIQSASATSRRADWLALPLTGAAAAAAPVAPAAATAPAAMPAARPPVAPAEAAPAPRKPLDAAGADEIERRLETLKRLRDKNLITEDEYRQKRREILQAL